MKNRGAIVLSSGGIDSTACMFFCKKEHIKPTAFFINYGQISMGREIKSLKKICKHYKIRLDTASYTSNNKFNDGEIVGRNAFFLLSALLTYEKKFEFIAIGIHKGTGYSDTSRIFVDQMQNIFDLYTDGSVRIYAPFLEWTKNDIWAYCKKNKIPINLTYSCELGSKQPCGKCLSCRDLVRLNASAKV